MSYTRHGQKYLCPCTFFKSCTNLPKKILVGSKTKTNCGTKKALKKI